MLIKKISVVCALLLFSLSNTCLAKPLPPDGLGDVFEQLAELEESYENGEWNEAAEMFTELEEGLNEIASKTPADYQLDFNNSLKGLHYGIIKKDRELTEKGYIRLTEDCINFCNNFDFKVHPLFSIINKYIGVEAMEAAEKSEFDEVVSEVREVAHMLDEFKDVFNENGIDKKELKELHAQLNNIVAAAKNKDSKLVKKNLEITDKYFASLLSTSS